MRVTILTFVLLLWIASLGQDNKPEQIKVWDSLYLRHQQEEETFDTKLKRNFERADTIAFKDSVVISFTVKGCKLLKKIVYRVDSIGCKSFERFEYYNDNEQIVYTRRHRPACPEKKATRKNRPNFYPVHYERFRYDEKGRLILYIDTWADKPYRVEYQYHADGTAIRRSRKISNTEFWNE